MNRERWDRIARLYEEALERPASGRAQFLEEKCGDDGALRHEIEVLLAQEQQAGPLDQPALDAAADLLGDAENLAPGTSLGPYRVDRLIGAGGMGEVYRAVDTRLDRTVAIKVLPADLSADSQFRDRFTREARSIAALSHPHICTLFDVGDHGGVDFLVLEYLEGETLTQRLERGVMPLSEVLRHAADIGEALAAAHRSGIVHRDLKPANIFITKSGVKLLDFGLAKTVPVVAGTRASQPVTESGTLTAQGTILGTFQYMAPEQLEGQAADTRTDIFAFGAVVYEMLTGQKAFQGKSHASLIGAILKDEPPPIDKSQPLTPPRLDRLVRRCLAKSPNDRWQSAADLADEMRWIAEGRDSGVQPSTPGVGMMRARTRSPLFAAAIGLAIGAAIAGVAAWLILRPGPEPVPQPARSEIVPSADMPLVMGALRSIAISPDGSHIVYRAGSLLRLQASLGIQAQLVVRPINELVGRVVSDTRGANAPFFSPDGRWIGFTGQGGLYKIPITGGTAVLIGPLGAPAGGATWAPDDTIIFADTDLATGLIGVPASGGRPTTLTVPDTTKGEVDHWLPSVLPDGRHVLFTIVAAERDKSQIAVLDRATGVRKVLIHGGTQADYANGHLVYATSAGTIHAVGFDPVRLEVLGGPHPLAQQVRTSTNAGVAQYAVSHNGTLVYVAGSDVPQPTASRSLVWVDRQQREEPIGAAPHAYAAPRLSPDGTRIAVQIRGRDEAIWTWDLQRETLTRLNSEGGSETMPVWTLDGQRIIFSSGRAGSPNLYWRPADGSGRIERLTTDARPQFPYSLSPDGTRIFIAQLTQNTQADVGVLMNGQRTDMLIQTTAQEHSAEISPDGRWLAYQSNESGRYEVYVRPYPNVDARRWTISTGGGTRPAWAKSGRELFYLDGRDRLTSVNVRVNDDTLLAGKPVTIIEKSYFTGGAAYGRPYDVSSDGRFLMIKSIEETDLRLNPATLVLVQNWAEELKRVVPAR